MGSWMEAEQLGLEEKIILLAPQKTHQSVWQLAVLQSHSLPAALDGVVKSQSHCPLTFLHLSNCTMYYMEFLKPHVTSSEARI